MIERRGRKPGKVAKKAVAEVKDSTANNDDIKVDKILVKQKLMIVKLMKESEPNCRWLNLSYSSYL